MKARIWAEWFKIFRSAPPFKSPMSQVAHTSKYRAVLTFPPSLESPPQTNLPTICQLFEQPSTWTAGPTRDHYCVWVRFSRAPGRRDSTVVACSPTSPTNPFRETPPRTWRLDLRRSKLCPKRTPWSDWKRSLGLITYMTQCY